MVDFSPLATCPACRYSLRGLPADSACPECGFAYDADTFYIRHSRPWVPLVHRLGVAFGGLLCFLGLQLAALSNHGSTTAIAGLAVVFAIIVVAAIKLPSAIARPQFAAFKRSGIELRLGRKTSHLAWDSIEKFEIRESGPFVRSKALMGSVRLDSLPDSHAEAAAMCAAANAIMKDGPDECGNWICGHAVRDHFTGCVPTKVSKVSYLLIGGIALALVSIVVSTASAFLPFGVQRYIRIATLVSLALVFMVLVGVSIYAMVRARPRL